MGSLFLIDEICKFLPTVGNKILEFYNNPHTFNVVKKDNSTPLTDADLAANQMLITFLSKLTPDVSILSEEGKTISFDERKKWDIYWLIDPLDGTKEFLEKTDEFTINVALIKKHTAIIGIIYHPISGNCYYSMAQQGAYLLAKDGQKKRLHTRVCPTDSIEVLISRHHTPKGFKQVEEAEVKYHFHRQGSALKFCRIAEGKADIYPRVGPTSEWDTAAGQCLVEEAGGLVLQASGNPLQYNTKPELENPPFIVIGDKQHDRIPWLEWLTMRLKNG